MKHRDHLVAYDSKHGEVENSVTVILNVKGKIDQGDWEPQQTCNVNRSEKA